MASFEIGDFVKITPNCPYYPELIEHDTVLKVLAPQDKDGEHRCCVYQDGMLERSRTYYPHPDYMVHCSATGDEGERGIVVEECEIIYDVHSLRVGDIVLILPDAGSPDEYYLGFVIGHVISINGMEVIDTRTGKKQYMSPAQIADGKVRYVHNSFDIYKDINIY